LITVAWQVRFGVRAPKVLICVAMPAADHFRVMQGERLGLPPWIHCLSLAT
jgi:hypothetical protein